MKKIKIEKQGIDKTKPEVTCPVPDFTLSWLKPQCREPVATPGIPTWSRYIDSRMKQFGTR